MVARQIQILAGALLYYGLVLPLSYLPFPILYFLSDLLFILFRTIIPYRKKVIDENIKSTFPNYSAEQQIKLRRDFYRFLSDLIIESIKNLSISEKALKNRMNLSNPEILEQVGKLNKPVILISSHYNNWEWLISIQALWFKKNNFGIGMPLSHPFWDKKLTSRRERFGLKVVHAQNYHDAFKSNNSIVLVLADQAPSSPEKCLWQSFLGRESAIIFGPEYMANKYDCAVIYVNVSNCKRGFYDVKIEVLVENSKTLEYGELTRLQLQKLEASIEQNPSRWLWSHRRWKHQKPDNWVKINKALKNEFEDKFR